MSVAAIVFAGVSAAAAITGTTVGAVKKNQASNQANGVKALDAGMRAVEEEEGLVDAMFASIEQGGQAMMQAGQEAISFLLQALSIGVR